MLSGAGASAAPGGTGAASGRPGRGPRALERQRQRLLEQLPDPRQELRAVGAVEDAVVADQCELIWSRATIAAAVVHGRLLRRRAHRRGSRPGAG